jgi:hypothetical protein
MDDAEIDAVMQRAISAVGRPCFYSLVPRHLMRARDDGWIHIGTVNIPEEWKAWTVYWHPELEQGWLWAMRWTHKGVQPRRFTPKGANDR